MKNSNNSTETKNSQKGTNNTIDNSQNKGATISSDRQYTLSLGGLAAVVVACIVAGGGSVFIFKDSNPDIDQINNFAQVTQLKQQLERANEKNASLDNMLVEANEEITSLNNKIEELETIIASGTSSLTQTLTPEQIESQCFILRSNLTQFTQLGQQDVAQSIRLNMRQLNCEQYGVEIP